MSVHQIKYSYLDVPTVERFADSNAFIRGLMGPFGCLSGDSEFLTPNGWKRMDAFEPGDLVAQWWPATDRIEFVAPVYVNEPCDELIEFDSGSLVMRLSDEHRVPHYNWAGNFEVKLASDIARKPSKRTIPTTFRGPLGSGLVMSEDLIRFAVMMHADGHYPRHGRKASVALRKERKKERLRALLERLQLPYEESVYPGRPTESVFRFEPPYRGKRFGPEWWSASGRQLEIVLDEVRHWDGHDGEIFVYASSHRGDADFIQYASHACGLRATISEVVYENPAWRPGYRVNIRKGDNPKNRAMVRRDTTVIRRVPALGGRKYCFQVPSSFFVARCDGSVFITGNSGKSSGCVIEIANRAQAQKRGPDGKRRTRFACIRNTYPELRNTTIKTLFQWLPPAHFGNYVENKHTYTVKAFADTEVEVVFLALDKPDDLKQLLSLELTGAWLNEAREIPWAVWEVLQGRVGRYPAMVDGGPSWSGIWADTNPPDSDSKWYKFFEEKNWVGDFRKLKSEGHLPMNMQEEDYAAIFKQPGGLAPNAENISNLPGGKLYYARLSAGKDPEWIKVYVDGQYGFVIDGRPVYGTYNDRIHCRADAEPVEGVTVHRGWDFGLTPACILSQMTPDGRWVIFDELVSEGMGIDRFSDIVLEHCAKAFRGGNVRFKDDGDPAGNKRSETDEKTCFQILQSKGIDIEASEVSLTKRLESVRLPLGRPAPNWEGAILQLNPRCKKLRKGFLGGYRFRRMQVSGERYTDDPDKNEYSHPHDALQYTACRLFGDMLTSPRFVDEAPPFSGGEIDLMGRSEFTGY